MSRTSRKNISIVGGDKKIYRVAGYIRLSVVKDIRDLDSIENQKSIIGEATEKKGDIVVQQFYIDKNATGTSFERDGLQQMMEDIAHKGKSTALLLKTCPGLAEMQLKSGSMYNIYFQKRVSGFCL